MRGKTEKSLEIIEASYQILEAIQPASLRAVCYRLFIKKLIPNMSKNATNGVSKLLVYARVQNLIPWHWMVDETRSQETIQTWDDPDSIIRAAVFGYRRNYWQDQPCRVEILSEKGTVRGTLAPILQEYAVPLRNLHGYSSATSVKDLANESNRDTKPFYLFYIGDFDPSGKHMSDIDLPSRLRAYGANLKLRRIALIDSDVHGTDLPSFRADSKKTDSRYPWYRDNFGDKCWELDALSPVVLRDRVEDAILSVLDQDLWDKAIEIENVEKESMQDFFQMWKEKTRAPK